MILHVFFLSKVGGCQLDSFSSEQGAVSGSESLGSGKGRTEYSECPTDCQLLKKELPLAVDICGMYATCHC
jgi:hypothetical protein